MTSLNISKNTEAKAIAEIWNMGVESLNPDAYSELDRVLKQLCETRNISNECLAMEHIILSGKDKHDSDCSTSDAPAYIPAPCNCGYKCGIDMPGFEGTTEALNNLSV